MSRRVIARAAALACVLVAVVVLATPTRSGAAGPQATGWWSRRVPFTGEVEGLSSAAAVPFTPTQELPDPTTVPTTVPGAPVTTVPLPVPTPTVPEPPVTLPEDPGPGAPNPTVPDGGLWVANDPAGAVAMSAVRYRGDVGSAELTLSFAPGSTTVGRVVACPALSPFQPAEGGPWRDRPAHDCDRLSLTGRLTPDGSGMQFSIPQSFLPFGERVLDILLLPDPTAGDVFSLVFRPPAADSLEVVAGQQLPAPTAELAPVDPSTLPDPPPIAGGDLAGVTGGVDLPPEGAGDVADHPSDTAASPPGASAPEPIADLLDPLVEDRFARIVAVSILLSMGAGFWLFGGAPVRHPRLLGALAGQAPVLVDRPSPAARGVGRFRRDRSAPPHRL